MKWGCVEGTETLERFLLRLRSHLIERCITQSCSKTCSRFFEHGIHLSRVCVRAFCEVCFVLAFLQITSLNYFSDIFLTDYLREYQWYCMGSEWSDVIIFAYQCVYCKCTGSSGFFSPKRKCIPNVSYFIT